MRQQRAGIKGRLVLAGVLIGAGLAPGTGGAQDRFVFGGEPGGRTIGGPGRTVVRGGSSTKIFTFLHVGPTPSRFVCLTGLNEGPGTLTVIMKSRIGESMTARVPAATTRVLCGEMTAIEVECHGQSGECAFRWRIDEPR